MSTITKATLISIAPIAESSKLDLDALASAIDYVFQKGAAFQTLDHQAVFLSQCAVESAWFHTFTENLDYGAQSLLNVFPSHFNSSNVDQYARNPQAIANRVYANRMGNGDEASGDGWNFRGRGLIQLTGKATYEACALALGSEIINNPDYLTTIHGAVDSAVWYWNSHKLSEVQDKDGFVEVTKVINGGVNGLQDRENSYHKALSILNFVS